jgi:hypothetical protein
MRLDRCTLPCPARAVLIRRPLHDEQRFHSETSTGNETGCHSQSRPEDGALDPPVVAAGGQR